MICIKKRNFLILLLSIFIFICFVNTAEAAGPDFNVSNCGNIKEPGLYWLNETINSTNARCLNITVDDVVLDCREFSINGTNRNAKDGIHINSSNVIVRNCRIKQFAIGINLSSAINISLINNTVFDNNVTGIFLASSNNSLLENNTAYSNNGTGYDNYGIHLLNSKNNRLIRNNASFNGDADAGGNIGIFLSTSTYNNLTYNIANNNTEYGIYLLTNSNNNRLINNTANNNSAIGIGLNTCFNNFLINNFASNNTGHGIELIDSDTNNLTSNKAKSNDYGIRLDGSHNNTLGLNIYLSNNTWGISLETAHNNTLINNVANNNTRGIAFIANSNNNTASNNVANNNNLGIYLHNSNNNTLASNTAENNTNTSIGLESNSNDNTIRDNAANNNGRYGIFLDASNENIFINNTCNSNGWDGIHLEGNSDLNNFRRNTILHNGNGYHIGGDSVNNTFTLCNLSNPGGWDIHMEDGTDDKFYNITVFSNGTIDSYKTMFSFAKYNDTDMHLRGVETPEGPPPAGLVGIGKYVDIMRLPGKWVVLNISYLDSEVNAVNLNESTLKMYRYNGTWKELNSTVNIILNFVSANLSNYSNFGLFGEELPEDNGNGDGTGNTGGNSGSSYSSLIQYYDFDLKKAVTKEFRRQDYFDFKRKNIEHKMTVTDVNTLNKQVTVKIASTPRLYTIDEGQTIKVDTDNNGYYDLSISLNKLQDITVLLTIASVDENIPVTQPPVRELEYTEPVEKKEEIKQVEEVKEVEQVSESKGIDKGTAVALIILLFFVLIGLIIVIKIIKKRRKEILLRKIKRFLNLRKKIWTPFKSWKQKKQPWNPFRKKGGGNLWNPLKKK